MTTITVREKDSRIWVNASGHAGYAEAGKDIVCSAISNTLTAWANLCESLEEEKKIEILKLTLTEGNVSILIEDPYEYTHYALRLLLMSFESISEAYPDYVALHEEIS